MSASSSLYAMKSSLTRFDSQINQTWTSTEVTYISSAIQNQKYKIDRINSDIDCLNFSIQAAYDDIRREEEEARCAAEEAAARSRAEAAAAQSSSRRSSSLGRRY